MIVAQEPIYAPDMHVSGRTEEPDEEAGELDGPHGAYAHQRAWQGQDDVRLAGPAQHALLHWIEPAKHGRGRAVSINVVVALSLLGFPLPFATGAAHFYLGQRQKAFACLFLAMALLLPLFLPWATFRVAYAWLYCVLVVAIFHVMLLLDARRLAARLRRGLPITTGECALPALATLPILPRLFMAPVIVSYSDSAPNEYKLRTHIQCDEDDPCVDVASAP